MVSANGKKALKSGVWYTIANFLLKGAVFLTTPIFTRLLTKTDVGIFSNYSAWVNVFIIIFTIEIPASINLARFDYKDKLDSYISSSLVLTTISTCLFFLLGLFLKDIFIKFIRVSDFSYYLIFVYVLFYPALEMYQLKWRIEYKYRMSVALSVISTLVSLGFSLFLTLTMDNKLEGRIVGFYTPLILINVAVFFFAFVKCHKVDVSFWPYILKISFPLVWHLLGAQLLLSSDRIMITNICGEESNAIYSVAGTCCVIPQVLWSSMNNAWSPWAYEQMDNHNYAKLKQMSKPYCLFFGFATICLLLIGPELLLLLGGRSYMVGLDLMPVLIISYVFQFVYSLFVNVEFYHKKQYIIAVGTIIAAALNVALNSLLLPLFGYRIAAYTTLVGYAVMFLIHYFVVRFYIKANWYDNRFVFLYLCFFLTMIPLFIILYNHSLVRYIFVAVSVCLFVIVLIVNRKTIVQFFRDKGVESLTRRSERQEMDK